jgi:hypothetical protein
MAEDIYSLKKDDQSRKIVTSHDDGTSIKFTPGDDVKLVQQANLQYNQRTEARFEVGSDNLYWACGQSQGNLTCNKLVGDNAIKSPVWGGMKDGFGEGRASARVVFNMNSDGGKITGDGVWQQAAYSMTVGDMSISDNCVMAVGFVTEQ